MATSISFKVKRSDGEYLTFGGSETLTIKTNGQRAVVHTAVKDSTAYTVTYVNDTVDKADIGNWTTLIHGLQKYASNGTEYTYTVEELVDQDGKPLDGSRSVIQNCHTTVTGSEAEGYVIKNEKVDTSLAIKKIFELGAEVGELTDVQKQKITFTVTGKFDGTNETTRTFTYGVDGLTVGNEQQQKDKYKWNDGVLVIKDIQPGSYTVTEAHDGVDEIFAGDTSGKSYTHTRTYTVTPENAGTVGENNSNITATVKEGERTDVTVTNKYDTETLKDLSFKKKWTDGVTTIARQWPEDAEGHKVPITVVLNGKLIETVKDEETGEETTSVIATLETGEDYKFEINPDAEESNPNNLPMPRTIKIGGVDTPVTVSLAEDEANGYTIKFEGLRKTGKTTEGDVTKTGEWQYYVIEEPISGYQPPKYQKEDGSYHDTGDGGAYEGETIVNEPIVYELPSTGGPGTTMFYVLGSILTLLAAVLLITKKRTDGQGIE